MTSTLIFLQVILSILLTIVVLMQKSSSIGLGAYSGSNESLFGAKGPMNFLQKLTLILGIIFVLNTLSLVYIYNSQKNVSVTDKIKIETQSSSQSTPSIPSPPTK